LKKLLTLFAFSVLLIVPASAQEAFACVEGDVQHWYTVIFNISDQQLRHETEPFITERGSFTISTNADEVLDHSNLNQKVADILNSKGYFIRDPNNPPARDIEAGDLDSPFINTSHSTICKNGIMQVVGGMLLQPDSATLVIAYGIANSIWIVPSVAGIGIAVYLVKRRF